MTNVAKNNKSAVSNENSNVKVETLYFENDLGYFECQTILTKDNESIVIASIFKKDLKGIAKGYIEVEVEVDENAEDGAEEIAIDRETELVELFDEYQNKGLSTVEKVIENLYGVKIDLIGERNNCRLSIRGEKPKSEADEVIEADEVVTDEEEVYVDADGNEL